MRFKKYFFLPACAVALSFTACNSGSSSPTASGSTGGTTSTSSSAATTTTPTTTPIKTTPTTPVTATTPTPTPSTSPSPTPVARTYTTDVMLFIGDGTWTAEITSIETILTSNGATYQEATSAQVNAMSITDMTKFGTFLFPGGEGSTEAESLTASTHALIREAVQQYGVSYIGFCAGAFIAVAPAPAAGQDVSYGIGVVNGTLLDYYAAENQGVDYEMTLESFPDGTTEDILWYGGPMTPNTDVIAKYPDGTPAISEMWSGSGFVVLSGVHPTADQAILTSLGQTSTDGVHTDFAWKLINAAITQAPLAHF